MTFAYRVALPLIATLAACSADPPPSSDASTATDVPTSDLGVMDVASPDVPLPDDATDASDVVDATDVTDVPAATTVRCDLADAAVTLPPETAGAPDGGFLHGPGGPARSFTDAEIDHACAHLHGGPTDRDHHNTVLMLDGHLYMPWAHESGGGGLSAWEFNDPCAPVHVGTAIDPQMRETHAAGLQMHDGRWMVTTSLSGVMFWDISDPRAMRRVSDLALPGVTYPDSYQRVVMSVSWQSPYVYVGAADNGLFVVDARDPRAPRLVRQVVPEPSMRVGGVHAVGNLLVALSTEGSRTTMFDISDPGDPRPIPGGSFLLHNGTTVNGRPFTVTSYFGHINGGRAYFARHLIGGGLITFDISDPSRPSFLGAWQYPGSANGGYVFLKEGTAFVGLSDLGVAVDVSDPTNLRPTREFHMTGDLDTVNPIGNVVVLSVDDDAVRGESSNVVPYQREPDRRGPRANWVVPRDGAQGQALTSRVGLTFDEFVDLASVGPSSFIVREEGAATPLEGWYSGQEGIVNFWPSQPLRPGARYEVIVPAGGVRDYSGNATTETFRSVFSTGVCGP